MKIQKLSIHRLFFLGFILVGAISILAIGALWIKSEWSHFENEIRFLVVSALFTPGWGNFVIPSRFDVVAQLIHPCS